MNIPGKRFWSYEAHHMRCVRENDYDELLACVDNAISAMECVIENNDCLNTIEILKHHVTQLRTISFLGSVT